MTSEQNSLAFIMGCWISECTTMIKVITRSMMPKEETWYGDDNHLHNSASWRRKNLRTNLKKRAKMVSSQLL